MSEQGFIYAIQSSKTKLIKIGFSVMPEGRVKGLQTGSPDKLKLLKTWPGTMSDEKRIHRCLKEHRVHGEWFEVSYDRAAFVIQAVIEPRDADNTMEHVQQSLTEAIEFGAIIRTVQQTSKDGETPVLVVQLWNTTICETHKLVHSGTACPMC